MATSIDIQGVTKRFGDFPAVYNAANEVCVDAFHEGRLRFTDIVDSVAEVVAGHAAAGPDDVGSKQSLSVDDVLAADAWARAAATDLIGTK